MFTSWLLFSVVTSLANPPPLAPAPAPAPASASEWGPVTVIAGGSSRGSYQGGQIWALTRQALSERAQCLAPCTEPDPVVVGSSAGSINALLMAVSLLSEKHAAKPVPEMSSFFRGWVPIGFTMDPGDSIDMFRRARGPTPEVLWEADGETIVPHSRDNEHIPNALISRGFFDGPFTEVFTDFLDEDPSTPGGAFKRVRFGVTTARHTRNSDPRGIIDVVNEAFAFEIDTSADELVRPLVTACKGGETHCNEVEKYVKTKSISSDSAWQRALEDKIWTDPLLRMMSELVQPSSGMPAAFARWGMPCAAYIDLNLWGRTQCFAGLDPAEDQPDILMIDGGTLDGNPIRVGRALLSDSSRPIEVLTDGFSFSFLDPDHTGEPPPVVVDHRDPEEADSQCWRLAPWALRKACRQGRRTIRSGQNDLRRDNFVYQDEVHEQNLATLGLVTIGRNQSLTQYFEDYPGALHGNGAHQSDFYFTSIEPVGSYLATLMAWYDRTFRVWDFYVGIFDVRWTLAKKKANNNNVDDIVKKMEELDWAPADGSGYHAVEALLIELKRWEQAPPSGVAEIEAAVNTAFNVSEFSLSSPAFTAAACLTPMSKDPDVPEDPVCYGEPHDIDDDKEHLVYEEGKQKNRARVRLYRNLKRLAYVMMVRATKTDDDENGNDPAGQYGVGWFAQALSGKAGPGTFIAGEQGEHTDTFAPGFASRLHRRLDWQFAQIYRRSMLTAGGSATVPLKMTRNYLLSSNYTWGVLLTSPALYDAPLGIGLHNEWQFKRINPVFVGLQGAYSPAVDDTVRLGALTAQARLGLTVWSGRGHFSESLFNRGRSQFGPKVGASTIDVIGFVEVARYKNVFDEALAAPGLAGVAYAPPRWVWEHDEGARIVYGHTAGVEVRYRLLNAAVIGVNARLKTHSDDVFNAKIGTEFGFNIPPLSYLSRRRKFEYVEPRFYRQRFDRVRLHFQAKEAREVIEAHKDAAQ